MDYDDRYIPVSRMYQQRYARRYSDHTFDKLRSIDIALAEFITMLDDTSGQAEVIAVAHESDTSVKELVLLVQWKRPLHVVIVEDDDREQERVATVYEPYPSDWAADFRRRR
ncbi:MAG: hypothetical protein WBF71_12060 [Microthrixaceae bacterium]